MAGTDLAVLVVYLAGVLGIGFWVGRRNRSSRQFMAAGGRLPGWVVGLSIFGTYVSSISFLGLPGKAYASNWNAFVFSLVIPPVTWIAVRWFVPFYRSGGEVSAYAHLERRFGTWARTYAVTCYILTHLARTGVILYLLALALAPLTGWDLVPLILVASAVVIVYAVVGGIEAVIWADALQSVVLMGGAFGCLAVIFLGMPEGPGQVFEIAVRHDKLSLGSFGPSLAESTFWVVLLYGIFMNLQNFGIDQSFVQRYATARSDREAAKSVWLGALLYLPISATFLLIGTGLFAYYAARPELLPEGTSPDEVFPRFIVAALPVGVSGLVIAGIVAAAQSTLSSSINCAATLILCDLYRRYLRPGAGERESMRVLRASTVLVGLAGTGVALVLIGSGKETLDLWWVFAGILSGGMLGLFLLGFLSRRATNAGAAIGVTVGVLVILWMSLSPWLPAGWGRFRSPFHSFLVTVVGTLTIFLVGLGVTALRRPRASGSAPSDPMTGADRTP